MRYTGYQPQYFPRLHYVARMMHTDVFFIRDDVQFVKNHTYPDGKRGKSYQAHSPIKQPTGIYYLSVPIKRNGIFSLANTAVSYDDNWTDIHLKTLRMAYARSPNF